MKYGVYAIKFDHVIILEAFPREVKTTVVIDSLVVIVNLVHWIPSLS